MEGCIRFVLPVDRGGLFSRQPPEWLEVELRQRLFELLRPRAGASGVEPVRCSCCGAGDVEDLQVALVVVVGVQLQEVNLPRLVKVLWTARLGRSSSMRASIIGSEDHTNSLATDVTM